MSFSTRPTTAEFDELYAWLQPSLWRYVHRLLGDGDATDDVVQECFVRLLSRPDLTGKEAQRWIFTVAMNLIRDGSRARARHARLLEEVVPPQPQGPPPTDRKVEREEAVTAVRRALEQLTERERQLLLMREEGFRHHEIAEAVGIAPNSVGTLIARAVKRFTQVYEPVVE